MALPDLSTVSDVRLKLLNVACDHALKREIDRLVDQSARFRRVLSEALAVDDEIDRRKEFLEPKK